MYEQFGDKRAAGLIDTCIETMSQNVSDWRGQVVKTIGDEVMASFDDAASACEAAKAMQVAIEALSQSGPHPLAIRIGFHFGSVLEGNMDFLGDTVNTSARVTALARRGQILTTANTLECLTPAQRAAARDLDVLDVRGKHEPVRIFEIPWQEDSESTMVAARRGSVPTATRICLTLQVAERTLEFVHGATPIWMGRDPSCEIIVHERMASRRHARIERRGERFYLVDESTNGTYVRLADGSEIHLRLEALQLRGAGQISLGAPTKDAADLVHFSD